MKDIKVVIPPAPKPLSKAAVTAANATDTRAVSASARAQTARGTSRGNSRVTAGDVPFLGSLANTAWGADDDCWRDHGRDRTMCSSPRIEERAAVHATVTDAVLEEEKFFTDVGVSNATPRMEKVLHPPPPAQTRELGDKVETVSPARGTVAATAAAPPSPRATVGGDQVSSPRVRDRYDLYVDAPAEQENPTTLDVEDVLDPHAMMAEAKARRGEPPVVPVPPPKKSPRNSSASFASRSNRFNVARPKVPPVGHYSVRHHVVDAEPHVPTIPPAPGQMAGGKQSPRNNKHASLEDTAHWSGPLNVSSGVHSASGDSASQSPRHGSAQATVRERTRQRLQSAPPKEAINTWPFISRTQQCRPINQEPYCAVTTYAVTGGYNDNVLSTKQHNGQRCMLNIKRQTGREKQASKRTGLSCAPADVIAYDFKKPGEGEVKGLCDFARQSPRSGVGSVSVKTVGQEHRRVAHSDVRSGGGIAGSNAEESYITDYVDLRTAGDTVNSKYVNSSRVIKFDKQRARPPLFPDGRVVSTDFVDVHEADKALQGNRLHHVNMAKMVKHPPNMYGSDCAVDKYDPNHELVDRRKPATVFDHQSSHEDIRSFGNQAIRRKQRGETNDGAEDFDISPTRPRLTRAVDFERTTGRKAPATEDPSSKCLDVDKVDTKLRQKRITGDPNMLKLIDREQRSKVKTPRAARITDDFYDVPEGMLHNAGRSPQKKMLLDFDRVTPRTRTQGGRLACEYALEGEHNGAIGPGTYLGPGDKKEFLLDFTGPAKYH